MTGLPVSISHKDVRCALCGRTCMVASKKNVLESWRMGHLAFQLPLRVMALKHLPWILLLSAGVCSAQTDCMEGSNPVDTAAPSGMSPQDLIQKFTAAEDKVRDARSRYTLTRDVLVQTLNDKSADGQWHEVAQISFEPKGKPVEKVTYAEVSTLRGIQLSEEDKDDIRTFMPWVLTSDQVRDYKLTYSGQQHVDDLDTYVFHVEPEKLEKNRRYFQGKIWVDHRDLQMVKLCGKSVPEQIHVKKHQPAEVRPTFMGVRQLVDGLWFPAYARIDDTLHFGVESIHVREVVRFKDYKLGSSPPSGTKP